MVIVYDEGRRGPGQPCGRPYLAPKELGSEDIPMEIGFGLTCGAGRIPTM
jgi:hypothetical protein